MRRGSKMCVAARRGTVAVRVAKMVEEREARKTVAKRVGNQPNKRSGAAATVAM